RAGAPENLVTAIDASHETCAQIIARPEIGYVSFTGSVRGGHEVYREGARRFIDVGLELGGKDPAYVAADADLDHAIANLVDGAEAVRSMNASPYGLTAAIWTRDQERAFRIGAQIETGTFFMNRCDYLDPMLPWTGVKDTGKGMSLSKYGFLPLTRRKSFHLRTQT